MSTNGIQGGGPAFPQRGDLEIKGMSVRHYTTVAALPVAMEMMKMVAQSGSGKVHFSPRTIAANARLIADAVTEELGIINAPK